jgi:hypothetical protein
MAAASTATRFPLTLRPAPETLRRIRVGMMTAAAVIIVSLLIVYGFDYYRLDFAHRVTSSKHTLLKPSGAIGRRLGMAGGVMFALVFLYPLRKRWPWLARKGKTRNWLDCHILLGLFAPAIITFHSSFKFNGVAGLAYWIMLAIVLSGIVGRYLYAQIPRRLDTAAMSLDEAQAANSELIESLRHRTTLPLAEVEELFRLPGKEEVQSLPLWKALAKMIVMDIERPLLFWKVRSKARRERKTGAEFDAAMLAFKRQSKLAKEIAFLSQAERIFHLWHIVHRPFSHAFGILSALHVTIILLLGYY